MLTMQFRILATVVIAFFIVLLEALWLFVLMRYNFITDSDVSVYIPWLIVAFFVPFFVGVIINGSLLFISSKSFRKKRFHTSVNWVALLVVLLGFAVIAVKKVPVQKPDQAEKAEAVVTKQVVDVEKNPQTSGVVTKQSKKVEKEVKTIKPELLSEPEKLFKLMKNSCFKSHSPDDGFNQVQMLDYCECVVEDAKSSMAITEIKAITKSLSTTKTSGEALLENDEMVGIVVECISKVAAKE